MIRWKTVIIMVWTATRTVIMNFFFFEGNVSININDEILPLQPGDVIVIRRMCSITRNFSTEKLPIVVLYSGSVKNTAISFCRFLPIMSI